MKVCALYLLLITQFGLCLYEEVPDQQARSQTQNELNLLKEELKRVKEDLNNANKKIEQLQVILSGAPNQGPTIKENRSLLYFLVNLALIILVMLFIQIIRKNISKIKGELFGTESKVKLGEIEKGKLKLEMDDLRRLVLEQDLADKNTDESNENSNPGTLQSLDRFFLNNISVDSPLGAEIPEASHNIVGGNFSDDQLQEAFTILETLFSNQKFRYLSEDEVLRCLHKKLNLKAFDGESILSELKSNYPERIMFEKSADGKALVRISRRKNVN